MKVARQSVAFMMVHGDLMTVIISLGIQPFAPILILCQTILLRLLISLGRLSHQQKCKSTPGSRDQRGASGQRG